jgi:hypothetical protein
MTRTKIQRSESQEYDWAEAPLSDCWSHLAALTGSTSHELLALQRNAVDAVLTDIAARHALWLNAWQDPGTTHWQGRWDASRDEIASSLRQCWGFALEAQGQLVELVIRVLSGRIAWQPASGSGAPVVERRQRAVVLNFPDRRVAARDPRAKMPSGYGA